jgi:aminoglycoside phosphotransferase (APT) family kinase protein
MTDLTGDSPIEPALLQQWLAETVDPSIGTSGPIAVQRLGGGHSSGAWRVDVVTGGGPRSMVLKAPSEPSVVYCRSAVREGHVIDELHRAGAPVPEVVGIDDGAGALGRPCFVMAHVPGRGVHDQGANGYHDDEELRAGGPDLQRAVWDSFHDALAAMHSVDPAAVPTARTVTGANGGGVRDVLDYWRESLVDLCGPIAAPRQLAALAWLRDHVPPGADDAPAVCLGDARLVNGIVDGDTVRALVDFEVAYVGNPLADVGYSLMLEARHQRAAAAPLALPSATETWERWSRATGRPLEHLGYWTAFSMTIICITATRAMLQWGLAGETVDTDNPMVADWHHLIEVASKERA